MLSIKANGDQCIVYPRASCQTGRRASGPSKYLARTSQGEPHCFIPLIGPFVQGIKANAKQLPHRHSMALICGLLSFVPFIAINYLYIQLFFYLCRCPVPVALCLLPMILNRVGEQSAIAVCFCCLFVAILFLFFALLPLLPPNEWLSWPGPIKCARLTA